MKNYSCIYFQDTKLHMTWHFGTPLTYPNGVNKGDEAEVIVVGKYNDNDVSCLIVGFKEFKEQPRGILLHITTRVENGAKPFDSGIRATKNGYKKIKTPYVLKGVWN